MIAEVKFLLLGLEIRLMKESPKPTACNYYYEATQDINIFLAAVIAMKGNM